MHINNKIITWREAVHLSVREELAGRTFGEWTVLEYAGNCKWLCKCSCGTVKEVRAQYLKDGRSKSCGHDTTRFKDLTGQKFGEWTVIKYVGNQKWHCKCSCGTERDVESYFLTSGKSKSCGHSTNKLAYNNISVDRTFQDLKGKHFGEWEVLEYVGKHYWKCRCSCGTIKNVHRYSLTSGASNSCGQCKSKEMIGKTFGRLTVEEVLGHNRVKCKCECGNTVNVFKSNLLKENGTRSCGCIIKESKPKKEEVISAIYRLTEKYNDKPFIKDLERELNRKETAVRSYIDEYGLREYINYYGSRAEREISSMFTGVQLCNRKIIKPYELDIYVQNKKLAIEYNGTYWHSELYKDKKYHQTKTIMCAKKGIRLIHIFEYEWEDIHQRNKLETILKYLNSADYSIIYGRNTSILNIKYSEAKEFLDKYHLQNSIPASICLGCYYKNQLVGVMTFGKARFNSKYDYELLRLCFKPEVKVIGGSEKLFKHFIREYNPESIITYCDISKFTGNVYTRLGFEPIQPNCITEPNYVWINERSHSIVNRYNTQKHMLVQLGIGTEEQSESEIMHDNGYVRVYDCGNLRLEWHR